MAIVNNQIITTGDIDSNVVDIYKKLMAASVGVDSVYIRAKETMSEVFKDGTIKANERAEIMANMLGQLTSSITNQAMTTAFAIAKDNKESPYALAKVSEDTRLTGNQADKITKESTLVDKQVDKLATDIDATVINGWKVQSDMIATNGITPNTSTASAILADQSVASSSTKYQEVKLGEAKVYETWSGAIRSMGNVNYTVSSGLPTAVTYDDNGLVTAQTKVARRQYDAFDDNMRQHAVNSSAAMLGVMIGSEAFTNSDTYGPYIATWQAGMNYLTGTGASNLETT